MPSAPASRCRRRPKKSGARCRPRSCRRRPNRGGLPMYAFEYHRPTSVADAISLLKGAGDGVLMAGGMTLIPTLKQRLASPSDVIDLGGVKELGRIFVDRGTIRGSIANNDPAADYPAAVLGLNAKVQTDRRTIDADDFFTGMFETALAEDEIVTEVRFPKPQAAAYAKFPNPASRYAIVGVFVARFDDGVRVAVTGAGPCVFRASDIESALSGNFAASALDGVTVKPDGLNSDIHASAEYRAHLVKVMAQRAVAAAS